MRVFAQAAAELHLVGQPPVARDGNLFEGGFLGLDNIGPIDRSHLPAGWRLEQADGTGWMAFYTPVHAGDRGRARPGHEHASYATWRSSSSSTSWPSRTPSTARGCGTRRTASSTTSSSRPTAAARRCRCARWSASLPLLGAVTVHEPQIADARRCSRSASAACSSGGHRRASPATRRASCSASPASGAVLFGIVAAAAARAGPRASSSTRPSSSRRTACARSPRRTVSIRSRSTLDGLDDAIDYQPAESTHGDVRRQLQLARAGVVPAQPPRSLRPRALRRSTSATTSPSSTRRARASGYAARRRGRPARRLVVDLPPRTRTAAARATAGCNACRTTRTGTQHSLFNEYFHGDNGAGPRRDPPDRLDRARRRPHLPAADERGGRREHRLRTAGLRRPGAAAAREWLLADGVGGYAMGTVAGLRTRRYHALLVAPSTASRRATSGSRRSTRRRRRRPRVRLATHEWASGAVDPAGHEQLVAFELVDGLPRWRWPVGDVVVERELAMTHGRPAVAVVHRLLAGAGPVRLELDAALHLARRARRAFRRGRAGGRARRRRASSSRAPTASRGPGWTPGGEWYARRPLREEADARPRRPRGRVGRRQLRAELDAGRGRRGRGLGRAVGDAPPPGRRSSRPRGPGRRAVLAGRGPADDVQAQLVLAADQFVVARPAARPSSPATRGSASGRATR